MASKKFDINNHTKEFKSIIESYKRNEEVNKIPKFDIFTKAKILLYEERMKNLGISQIDFAEDDVMYKGKNYRKSKPIKYLETDDSSNEKDALKIRMKIRNNHSSTNSNNISKNKNINHYSFNTPATKNLSRKNTLTGGMDDCSVIEGYEGGFEKIDINCHNLNNFNISNNLTPKKKNAQFFTTEANEAMNSPNLNTIIYSEMVTNTNDNFISSLQGIYTGTNNITNNKNKSHLTNNSNNNNNHKYKNKSLLINREDILPMIFEAKKRNKFKHNKNSNSHNFSSITSHDNINEMKNYLINKVEKSFTKKLTEENKNLSQKSIFTNVSQKLILNSKLMTRVTSPSYSRLSSANSKNVPDKSIAIRIRNAMDENITKKLIDKINNQIVIDDILNNMTEVQNNLIKKSKKNSKIFNNYRNNSDELKKRILYVMNNKFL